MRGIAGRPRIFSLVPLLEIGRHSARLRIGVGNPCQVRLAMRRHVRNGPACLWRMHETADRERAPRPYHALSCKSPHQLGPLSSCTDDRPRLRRPRALRQFRHGAGKSLLPAGPSAGGLRLRSRTRRKHVPHRLAVHHPSPWSELRPDTPQHRRRDGKTRGQAGANSDRYAAFRSPRGHRIQRQLRRDIHEPISPLRWAGGALLGGEASGSHTTDRQSRIARPRKIPQGYRFRRIRDCDRSGARLLATSLVRESPRSHAPSARASDRIPIDRRYRSIRYSFRASQKVAGEQQELDLREIADRCHPRVVDAGGGRGGDGTRRSSCARSVDGIGGGRSRHCGMDIYWKWKSALGAGEAGGRRGGRAPLRRGRREVCPGAGDQARQARGPLQLGQSALGAGGAGGRRGGRAPLRRGRREVCPGAGDQARPARGPQQLGHFAL